MPNLRNEIDSYLQNLLALQFKASSGISHNLTKGELREKFVKIPIGCDIFNFSFQKVIPHRLPVGVYE